MAEVSSHNAIWQMLDRVHAKTGVPNSDVGVALAALIFLRWADFEEAEREAIAAFDDVDYEPVLPAKFHWRSWCNIDDPRELERVFQELPSALHSFANSRHDAMATQLHRVAPAVEKLAHFPAATLAELIHWLAEQPFETPKDRRSHRDLLDTVLANTYDKFAGQFFTPVQIAALMVELANPKTGESVYDPCFGSAGLLTAALEAVQDREHVRLERGTYAPGRQPLHLAGVEVNQDAYGIGLTRLVLSGVNDPQIELGNSLERVPSNNPSSEGFDIVLTNPPWGMKIELDGVNHYPIPTKDSSSLFLQHAISQLRPGGRGVMVVPPSLLFRSGREQHLREWLLRENTVEAVVSIPSGAFSPHTSIETCLLMFRRGGTTKSVRMANAESMFDGPLPSPQRRGSGFTHWLARFNELIQSPEAGRERWEITIEELSEIEYDLTPKRRDRSGIDLILDSLPKEAEVRLLKDCCTIMTGRSVRSDKLQNSRSSYKATGSSVNESLLSLGVLDVRMGELAQATEELVVLAHKLAKADLESRRDVLLQEFATLQVQRHRNEKLLGEGIPALPYIRIGDVQNGQATRGSSWLMADAASSVDSNRKLRAGDILLSKSGTIGKSGIVRNGAVGGIASSGFFVLRVNEGIDPHFLLAYLQSNEANVWMEDRARGAAAKHLSVASIKELPVALPPLQIQQRTAEQHRKYGVDALTYLAELLTEDDSASLASELNDWVSRNLKRVESYEGDLGSPSVLELLEQVADSECPVNTCKECGHPYHLDYTTEHLDWPTNYSEGIATTCLACWLDVGPGSDTVESLAEESPIAAWALAFSEASKPLSGVSSIPDPASLISVLQSTEVAIHQSTQYIEGNLPNQERANRLSIRIINLSDSFTNHLVSDHKIVANVVEAKIHASGTMRVRLTVENKGRVPLRDVRFSINPPMKAVLPSHIPFLATGSVHELEFEGHDQGYSDDPVTALRWSDPEWSLNWTARNLAGKPVEDKRELGIDFSTDESAQETPVDEMPTAPLLNSPYITGNAIGTDRSDVFVGREELIEGIRHVIGHSGNVVLLEGNRRAGKSSILRHLEGQVSIPGWLGVYVSFQESEGDSQENTEGIPTVEVFRTIALATAKTVQRVVGNVIMPNGTELGRRDPKVVDLVREGIKADAPFTYFREYIELLVEWLASRDLRLLILLDEFDKLQDGIESGITSPQVPENLRFILQSNSRLTAILTSMKRLRRLREEYLSVLYGLGTPFDVTSLSKEDAETLVTDPVKGQLVYASQAVARAVYLVARQPYLLQCLCESIFCAAKASGVRSITVDHVNEAATDVLKNRHFNDLFRYAGTERRRFILAMCHREAQGPDKLRLPVIREKLSSHGIEVSEEELTTDLEWLTDLELLDFSGANGGETYSLTVPLMGLWIDTLDYTGLMSKARAESADTEDVIDE